MAPMTLPERDLFAIDNQLFERPEAQRALQAGQLEAKAEALKSAKRLVWIGRPLSIGVIAVSFIHLWDRIASIKPADVTALDLSAGVYHGSSGLLTFFVDAVALYLVATRAAAGYTGRKPKVSPAIWFFYALTALLNFSFVLANSAMPAFTADWLYGLNFITAVMLALLIPVSIAAIESAIQVCETAKLKLMVEVKALTVLAKNAPAVISEAIDTAPAQSDGSAPIAPQIAAQQATEAPARRPALEAAEAWLDGRLSADYVAPAQDRPAPQPAGVVYAWPKASSAAPALAVASHEARPEAEVIEAPEAQEPTQLDVLIERGAAWLKERLREGAELNAEIVRLKDEEGMTFPQIAKALQLSSSDNARSRYRAAKGTK